MYTTFDPTRYTSWDFPVLTRFKRRYRVMRAPDGYIPYQGEVCAQWDRHWEVKDIRLTGEHVQIVLQEITVSDYFTALRNPLRLGLMRTESILDKHFNKATTWDF